MAQAGVYLEVMFTSGASSLWMRNVQLCLFAIPLQEREYLHRSICGSIGLVAALSVYLRPAASGGIRDRGVTPPLPTMCTPPPLPPRCGTRVEPAVATPHSATGFLSLACLHHPAASVSIFL